MSYEYFAINNTNTTYTIREYPDEDVTSNKIIGKLYPNEICGCNTENDSYVMFLNSKGVLDGGLIYDQEFNRKEIRFLPYSKENINGTTYLIYKMRKTKNVYKAGGSYWGSVAAGMYVATDTARPGESHRDWMKVTYVKSTKGEWVRVTGDGVNYGFVDTGLSVASAGSKIALQGNW